MDRLKNIGIFSQKYIKTVVAVFYAFAFLTITLVIQDRPLDDFFYKGQLKGYNLNDDWIFIKNEDTKESVDLPFRYQIVEDGKVVLLKVLNFSQEANETYNTIAMKVSAGNFVVHSNQNTIYRYTSSKNKIFTTDMQYRWHIMNVNVVEPKETLSIVLPKDGGKYKSIMVSKVIYGKGDDVYFEMLSESIPMIVASLILIFIIAVQIVLHKIIKSYGPSKITRKCIPLYFLVILGMLVPRISVLATMPYIYDILNYIFYISIILVPIVGLTYVVDMEVFLYKKVLKFAIVLSYLNAIIFIVTSLVKDFSVGGFYGILYMFLVNILSCILIAATYFAAYTKANVNAKRYLVISLGYLAFTLGLIYDANVFLYRSDALSLAGISIGAVTLAFVYMWNMISISIDYVKIKDQKLFYKIMSSKDSLTGVKNNNAYISRINEINSHIDEITKDLKIGIMIIDINNLKHINDTYGHDEGDTAIRVVADSIVYAITDSWECYRIGGDEFAVIFINTNDREIEQIIKKMNQSSFDMSASFKEQVEMAVGYAYFNSEKDETMGDTQIRADKNMYNNKRIMKREKARR